MKGWRDLLFAGERRRAPEPPAHAAAPARGAPADPREPPPSPRHDPRATPPAPSRACPPSRPSEQSDAPEQSRASEQSGAPAQSNPEQSRPSEQSGTPAQSRASARSHPSEQGRAPGPRPAPEPRGAGSAPLVPERTRAAVREVGAAFAPPRPEPAPPAPRAPGAAFELLASGGRRRLVLVDLGELRTRAHGYDITASPREPILIGRVEHESAVLPGELPARVGAPRGLRTATSERAEPPAVIGRPGGGEDDWLLVGQGAATLGGHDALVAADPSRARLEALLHASLFPLVREGDHVELTVIDGPNGAQRPLEELLAGWQGRALELRGLARETGEVERRRIEIGCARVPAGDALLELLHARGALVEEGPPALILDLGHRSARFYLTDFDHGLLDLDVIPHGGASFLEHARRYAEERGWRPGGDIDLLRQLDDGTDMLSFGGMSFMTRKFFEAPRQELVKAITGCVAARLRHHLEQGGRWPRALCLIGGAARALADDLAQRLAARGLAVAEVEPLPPRPSPALEGALHAWRRGSAVR